jgi:cytosine/adenosine deaminase-related metal-dependent hydrolase
VVGELVVQGDSIACVAADCPDPPGATVIQVSRAFVYPGFVDAHNHVAYNFLPRWKPPRNDYPSRYHWQRVKEYGRIKAQYNRVKANVPCDMIKYGEIKALMSGITAIQGTSPASACVEPLIRNAENRLRIPDVGAAHIRTYILDVRSWDGPAPDWTATRSLVLHLGEGRNEASREELGICKQKGLLTAQTAIIHGTAFGEAEFRDMAAAGAKLIWSPMSNLALYDSTADIPLARRHGIPVSLGVDWNLSGSDHVFDELRVAQEVNEERFGGAIPDSAWLRMITSNPAKALGLERHLGRLRPGYKADLVVLRAQDPDPVRSLFGNSLQDVQMVWVGGRVLYGNEAAVMKLRPSGCERLLVKGSRKRACVSDPADPAPEAGRSLAEIEASLRRFCANPAPLAP